MENQSVNYPLTCKLFVYCCTVSSWRALVCLHYRVLLVRDNLLSMKTIISKYWTCSNYKSPLFRSFTLDSSSRQISSTFQSRNFSKNDSNGKPLMTLGSLRISWTARHTCRSSRTGKKWLTNGFVVFFLFVSMVNISDGISDLICSGQSISHGSLWYMCTIITQFIGCTQLSSSRCPEDRKYAFVSLRTTENRSWIFSSSTVS